MNGYLSMWTSLIFTTFSELVTTLNERLFLVYPHVVYFIVNVVISHMVSHVSVGHS